MLIDSGKANGTFSAGKTVINRNSTRKSALVKSAALSVPIGTAFIAGLLGSHPSAMGASQTWVAAPVDNTWVNGLNWSGGAAPGAINPTGNTVNGDVATFNTPLYNGIGGASDPIATDATRYLGGITFDTANAGAYVFSAASGATALQVCHNGTIQMTSTVVNPETFNELVQVRLPSSTNGVYNFVNNASSGSATLNFLGGIGTNAANTRPTTYNLSGTNTGNNLISSLTNNAGTSATVVNKTGTGLWIITGASTTTFNTSAGLASQVNISGGTLAIQNAASLGSGTIPVVIGGGTLREDNGITLNNTSVTLNNGGNFQSNAGNNGIATLTVGTTGSASETLSTVSATDTLMIGNSTTNSLTGGAASSVLHVAGPGTVFLPTANNFAGTWSIDAGTLKLNTSTSLGSATTAAVAFGSGSTGTFMLNNDNVTIVGLSTDPTTPGTAVVENGGGGSNILTINNSAANTFAGTIIDGPSGNLGITKGAGGVLTLAGANTYTNNTIVNAGTLLLTNTTGSATGPGTLTVNTGGTLGGTGSAAGAVTLNSGSTLSPGTTGVGTLTLGSLTLNSGSKLNYDITSPSVLDQTVVTSSNGLNINGGTLSINGGLSAFTTNGSYNLIKYSGSIGGTGVSALSVNSSSENIASNNYAFSTSNGYVVLTVSSTGGTLAYYNADANGNWSTGPWTGGVTPNAVSAFAGFGGGGTTITAPRTVTVDGSYTVGTLSFNNQTYSYTLAAGNNANLTLNNGTAAAAITDSAGSHFIQSPLTLTTAGATATVINSGDVLSISGTISGTSGTGALTKAGAGTLALTGTNAYFGGTMLNGGTLQINNANSLGDPSGNLVFGGGTLQLLGNVSSTRIYNVNGDSAASSSAVVDTNGYNLSLGAAIVPLTTGTGGLTKNGAGILTLGASNSYTGPTTLNAGTLAISSNTNLGDQPTAAPLVLNGGVLESTATFSLDDGTNLRPVTLGSANSTISADTGTTLTINALISGSGTLNLPGPGTVAISNTANAIPINLSGGTLTAANNSTNNGGLGSGAITLSGGATINTLVSQNNTMGFGNPLYIPAGQSGTIDTPQRFVFQNVITGSGTLNINVTTLVSRLQFSNNLATFNGNLNFNGSGTAQLLINGGTYNAAGMAGIAVDLEGTVFLGTASNSTGNIVSIGALSGTSTTAGLTGTVNNGGSPTYSIGNLNTSTGFAGEITTNSSLSKVGTGMLTLSGTNTYTGPTNVSGGTLAVTQASALPVGTNLSIGTLSTFAANNSGAAYGLSVNTFNNTGILNVNNNAVVIHASTLAAVTAMAQQGFGGGTWNGSTGITSGTAAADTTHLTAVGVILNDNAGSALYSSIDGAATVDGDVIAKYTYFGDTNLDGKVDASDYSRIDSGFLTGATGWFNGDFNYDGVINGSDYTLIDNAFNRQSAVLSAQTATATAQIGGSAVPEPTTLGLLGIGAVGLLGRRRRA